MSHENLSSRMLLPLALYDARISAAGIRYGSVAYIAFGEGVEKHHQKRPVTTQHPIEIEVGADFWEIVQNGSLLMDSNFTSVLAARLQIASLLVGRKLHDIATKDGESRIEMDEGLVWRSNIIKEPASGFLYSFQVDEGQSWETVDGLSAEND